MKTIFFAIFSALFFSSAMASQIPAGMTPCPGCGAADSQFKTKLTSIFSTTIGARLAPSSLCRNFQHDVLVKDRNIPLASATVTVCRKMNEGPKQMAILISLSEDDEESAPQIEKFLRKALAKEKNGLPKTIEKVEVKTFKELSPEPNSLQDSK